MKITEVTYSFSCKINLGNYESCDVFCAAKAPVDADESADEVFKELRNWVRGKVRDERKAILNRMEQRLK